MCFSRSNKNVKFVSQLRSFLENVFIIGIVIWLHSFVAQNICPLFKEYIKPETEFKHSRKYVSATGLLLSDLEIYYTFPLYDMKQNQNKSLTCFGTDIPLVASISNTSNPP